MDHFQEVKGYKELKRELEYILDILISPEKYRKLGVTTPKGILLDGDPGVGKTLMANCFIAASKRKVFVCRKNKPNGSFVEHIKEVFDEAKANAPSIVLLDDMDKFANEDTHHRNAEEYVTIQSCIDELSSIEVFVFATVNDTHNLPDSVLRAGRFDQIFHVQMPRGKDAEEIIRYYIERKKHVADIDIAFITKLLDGRSCAELETVINEAGIRAGYNNKEVIEMEDVVEACIKIFFSAPESIDCNDKEVEKTAYHEAGHTVIAEILEPDSVNLVSVRPHEGRIGGITSYCQDENYFRNKYFMEYRVMALLGGKAATEIIYGDVDVGANSDLHRAFDITTRFVDNYCSTGFDRWESRNSSDNLRTRKELNVYFEMEKYYSIVKKILIKNKEFLIKIANELIEKHTIIAPEIKAIKAECSIDTAGIIL